MNSAESFERDVRASLRASAVEPVPEELVARIGEIPAREPSPRARAGGPRLVGRLAMNLAAAAVVLVAVAVLIVSRNGTTGPIGGQPTGSPGPATPGASAAPTLALCAIPASPSGASPDAASPNVAGSTSGTASVVVTLGIYSGRPDPVWTLTVGETASLDAILAALPDGTGTPPVGGLGYHGFTISRPESSLVAFGGAVATPGDGPRTMKADPARSVERCLLETSRSRVTGDEYSVAETAIAATPTASPAASTSPAPSATAGTPSPDLALSPVSVTFVSPDDGWVLGTGTCPSGPCAAIERTADGGRTWAAVPAPDAPIFPGPSNVTPGISGIRFADSRNGWAFGPDLWATHDGGTTWTRLAIPGLAAGTMVAALETSGGTVHAAVLDGGGYRVASGPIGTDDFKLSPVRVPVGAGPVPAVQLVLSGSAGWLVENDRTVVGGARLVDGAWVTWTPPCLDVVGPAFLAASSPTELSAACDVGAWSTPQGSHLYLSHDGGSTFVESATAVPLTTSARIAAAPPSVIVVGGSDATGAVLVATFDGGRTWSVVARPGAVDLRDLGFTTASQGVVITVSGEGPGTLQVTRDGGHTWRAVPATGG